jgi:hypothetical protein
MQGRSWMAALALATGVALAPIGRPTPTRAGDSPAPAAVLNKVTLTLRITGLGDEGCEVEIKPGHAACQFETQTKKVKYGGQSQGELSVAALPVKSTSPDRDCQFTITIKEPGQPPRTVRRGIRLVVPTPGAAVPEQTFKCYLRSPSLAAKDDAERRIK